MRVAILIIGSLWWDEQSGRQAWRNSRLCIDQAVRVEVPIGYRRKSASRGNTYTMTFAPDSPKGAGILVPCRRACRDAQSLATEAALLWRAEKPQCTEGSISSDWGCIGAMFADNACAMQSQGSWARVFASRVMQPISPVSDAGVLRIPWPTQAAGGARADIDIILATATKATGRATPEEVADAWLNQDGGHEGYFFKNVAAGIRTPEDLRIWHRLEERSQTWDSRDAHADAIETLRTESANRDGDAST